MLVLQAPADAGRFFVVQKAGIVSVVSPDGAASSDFIDITSHRLHRAGRRDILHSNCSQCHRPAGPAPNGDFRFGTTPSQGYRGKPSVAGDLGVPGALLVAPGLPDKSLVLLRMQTLDEHRMPPLASHVVDQASVEVLTSWIGSLTSCP